MKVGIFDSGIGGLTVLKSLLKKYPNIEYIYYGDTLNLPYGTKTVEELNKLASQNIEFLIKKGAKIIVIACGTVSSNCLDFLQNKYDIPIYNIITPVIEFLNNSSYKNIGIIATTRTINSHLFKEKINKNVIEIAIPELVPLIEANELNKIPKVINKYLLYYYNKLDILVLGCTHFPIISQYLYEFDLLDMGSVLELNLIESKQTIDIYFSSINDTIILNTKKILNEYKTININY